MSWPGSSNDTRGELTCVISEEYGYIIEYTDIPPRGTRPRSPELTLELDAGDVHDAVEPTLCTTVSGRASAETEGEGVPDSTTRQAQRRDGGGEAGRGMALPPPTPSSLYQFPRRSRTAPTPVSRPRHARPAVASRVAVRFAPRSPSPPSAPQFSCALPSDDRAPHARASLSSRTSPCAPHRGCDGGEGGLPVSPAAPSACVARKPPQMSLPRRRRRRSPRPPLVRAPLVRAGRRTTRFASRR